MPTRLRARLAGTTPRPARLAPAALLGVEHEYRLRDATGPVDFRRLLHRLPVDGRRLDPGDPNAYRCAWGGALTCDGPEAEIACPPVPGRPGFAQVVDAWTRIARRELEQLLPAGVHAEGYSTHLNAALDDARAHRVARRYARTYGPGLMLLLDRRDSPGLLVRPRPRRIELGGEYVTGLWLRAATAYVAGSTRAAARGLFPPRIAGRIEPAIERYGWYVDRRAFGSDLYATGRETQLRRVRRGTITAQDQLGIGWALARDALDGVAGEADLRDVDRVVAGDLPLPVEADEPVDEMSPAAPLDGTTAQVLTPRVRAGYSVRAELATWDFVVFALCGPRTGYLCIPRDWLADFFAELEAGELDDDVRAFLDAPSRDRVLAAAAQTSEPGFFDRVGSPDALLPNERDPVTGRPGGGGAGPGGRRGKQRGHRAPRPRGRWILAGAAVAVVAVVALVLALVVGSGGGSGHASTNAASAGAAAGTGSAGRRVGPDFRPFGTASANVAYTQDGAYRVTQAITVSPTNVRPGDTVRVTTHTTSSGPNWVSPQGSDTFNLNCQGNSNQNFSNSSTSKVVLGPASSTGTDGVSWIAAGAGAAGSVSATTQLAPSQLQTSYAGCTRNSSVDNIGEFTVPPGTRPGKYALVPTWGIFVNFPDRHGVLTYNGGGFTEITVVRT